jgi:dihydrofolate reductase
LQSVILSNAKDLNNHQDSSAKPQNDKKKLFDACDNPFIVILSKHNYPSQTNRHFTHAKPKNILKLLDEKGRSSTVICGGLETAKLFLDAGVVDMVHVYHEDVDVGEGIKFSEELLDGWQCIENIGYKKVYFNTKNT